MSSSVTFPLTGDVFTNDNSPTTGMGDGHHRDNLFPLIENVLLVAEQVVDLAASAANSPGTSASSTSSVSIGIGTKTFTIETGKDFSIGQNVVIAYTLEPTTKQMSGKIKSYNDTTGELQVDILDPDAIGTGTYANWTISLSGSKGVPGFSMMTLPILSTTAAARNLVTSMLPIFDSNHSIASLGFWRLMWAGSQFIAVPETANVNVYTSPDLKTWTARSVSGVSTLWTIRNNGANVIALQSNGSAPRKSTDGGVTWSATTALPGATVPNGAAYASSGIFILATTNTTYVTTNHGTSWSTSQNMPHTSTNVFAMGANFVSYNSSSGTYYTSVTGMAGDWTARTLPNSITAGTIYEDGSNGLLLVPTDTTKNFWGTTDGINWTDLGFNASSYQHGAQGTVTFYIPFKVNGVWCVGSNLTTGSVFVKHAGSKWIPTQCATLPLSLTTPKSCLVAGNGSGLYGVKPNSTSNILLADGASTKCTGYFI